MLAIAIDPGGTTGIAIRKSDGSLTTITVTTPEGLYTLIKSAPWEQVICENFVTGGHIDKWGLHTVRLVGGIEALCYIYNLPLDLRMPRTRIGFLPKAQEALLNIKHVVHEVDALAHLLQWEANQKVKEGRTLKQWIKDQA